MHFVRIAVMVVLVGSVALGLHHPPLRLHPVRSTQCGSERGDAREAVRELLDEIYMTDDDGFLPCPCLNSTQWRSVAHLNFTDPSQSCPSNWSTNTDAVRGCSLGSQGAGCYSTYFDVESFSYNRVCGRIVGFQKGTADAFNPYIRSRGTQGLETVYVDGLSLTHGNPGARQHIWTFAVGFAKFPLDAHDACDCSNTNMSWPSEIPSFVGSNYFCETGNTGPSYAHHFIYSDDPLWDGQGCGPTSTCCQKNNPPWFCATLPQATSDDLELRLCSDEGANEGTVISYIELYVAFEENE